jgi:hypothetical protein
MYFFDYSTLSGMPPIGVDLNLGALVAGLLLALVVSALAILFSRNVALPRRGILRLVSRPQGARTMSASGSITLPRAIRLTTGSRK